MGGTAGAGWANVALTAAAASAARALQNVTSATLNKALGQDGDFGDALTSTLANTFAAAGFNWGGDFSQNNQLADGSRTKIGLHAIYLRYRYQPRHKHAGDRRGRYL